MQYQCSAPSVEDNILALPRIYLIGHRRGYRAGIDLRVRPAQAVHCALED